MSELHVFPLRHRWIPNRIRCAFAVLRGKPVGYRLRVVNGSIVIPPKGAHFAECEIRVVKL